MDLIKCIECGNEISQKAKSCPKCGCLVTIETRYAAIEKKKENTLGIVGCLLSFCIFNFIVEFVAFMMCLFSLRDKQKGKSCGMFGLILSTLALLLHIFVLDTNIDETKEATNTTSETQIMNDNTINATYDKCTLKYLRHELVEDASGTDCIAIFYEFTNNSSENKSCILTFSDMAFQNGVEIDKSIYFLGENENNDTKEIQPGISIEVYSLYKYKNKSNLELEIYPLVSFDGKPLDTMTLSLE